MGLRDFLQQVERQWPEQVRRIDKEIDPRYEITGAVTLLERRRQSPILWFKNVKGTKYPVVVNVTGSRERVAAALGVSAKEIVKECLTRFEHPLLPMEVTTGPVKEVVLLGKDADVLKLPQITHHHNDGGPYITAGIAFAKDPETGVYNASYNRFMMKEPGKLGIYMTAGRHLREFYSRYKEKGVGMPLAIVIGVPPPYSMGAAYAGPLEIDEIAIMGSIAGAPVPLVRCETIDLMVPADAEIVIEGEVPPNVLEIEGPLGEFTGYSSGARQREVFEVKAITTRKDAIFQDISPGHHEMFFLSAPVSDACSYRIIKNLIPSLQDINVAAPFTLFMSMKQRHEGQAKQAIFAAMAAEFYFKTVVVVDDDIDVHNTTQVLWAIATRAQADRDVFVVGNALGAGLDPSSLVEGIGAKMGIDATAKPSLGEYAPRNGVPREVLERLENSGIL